MLKLHLKIHPSSPTVNEWEWRGGWWLRHHWQPRRKHHVILIGSQGGQHRSTKEEKDRFEEVRP
eukprot:7403025-Prorocentrum_lima.AAC.1